MPFVHRDGNGNIVRVSALQTSVTNEFISDDSKEFKDYIKSMLEIYGADTYVQRRKIEYPIASDALDCIMKTFKYLIEKGVDIGPDGEAWVNACESVKNKIPKDWKPE